MLTANQSIYFKRNVLNMRAVAGALDVPIVFVLAPHGNTGDIALAEQAAFLEQSLYAEGTLCLNLSDLSADGSLFVNRYNLTSSGIAAAAEAILQYLLEEGFIE